MYFALSLSEGRGGWGMGDDVCVFLAVPLQIRWSPAWCPRKLRSHLQSEMWKFYFTNVKVKFSDLFASDKNQVKSRVFKMIDMFCLSLLHFGTSLIISFQNQEASAMLDEVCIEEIWCRDALPFHFLICRSVCICIVCFFYVGCSKWAAILARHILKEIFPPSF